VVRRPILGNARRIQRNELDAWYACPKRKSDHGFRRWVQSEKAWVKSLRIPRRNLFVFESRGRFLGKLCFAQEGSDWIVFLAPVIAGCPGVQEIAVALFHLATKEACAREKERLEAKLDRHNNHYKILKASLLKAGFVVEKHKFLYTKDLRHWEGPQKKIEELRLTTIRKFGWNRFKRLFVRSVEGSLDDIDHPNPPTPGQFLKEAAESAGKAKEGWRIASLEGKPFGVVMPDPLSDGTGSFYYISVVPRFRGMGLGKVLLEEGLTLLKAAGVSTYIGSTAKTNKPMIRVFRKAGCKKLTERIEFVYHARNRRCARSHSVT
jgi:ribosomal protein S18 acetylase RimI-like enzyme